MYVERSKMCSSALLIFRRCEWGMPFVKEFGGKVVARA